MAASDMFHSTKMFWVVGDVYGALVVGEETDGIAITFAELMQDFG